MRTLKQISSVGSKTVDLVLTKTKVIMKISEESLGQIDEDLSQDLVKVEEQGWIEKAKNVVLSAVDKIVNKSIEYTLDEINEVKYEGGQLKFDYNARHLCTFNSIVFDEKNDVLVITFSDNGNILSKFDSKDAQEFVEEFQKAKTAHQEFLNA